MEIYIFQHVSMEAGWTFIGHILSTLWLTKAFTNTNNNNNNNNNDNNNKRTCTCSFENDEYKLPTELVCLARVKSCTYTELELESSNTLLS